MDLFYVAAAYNLGNLLMSGLNINDWERTILYTIGIFGGLYDIFVRSLLYNSQFLVLDFAHTLLELFRTFWLAWICAHISPINWMSDPNYMEVFGLSLGFFLETLVHILLEIELYFCGKGDRIAIQNQSKRRLFTHILPLSIIYLVATITSGMLHHSVLEIRHSNNNKEQRDWSAYEWNMADVPLILIFTGVLYSHVVQAITAVLLSPKLNPNNNIKSLMVPTNIDFLIHRLGEYTMIFFGEAVMALIIEPTGQRIKYYVQLVFGIMSVMMLQIYKYESEPHGKNHYLYRGYGLKSLFVYSLLTEVLCLFMIGLAISYKSGLILVAYAWNEENFEYKNDANSCAELESYHNEEYNNNNLEERRRLNSGVPEMGCFCTEVLMSISLAIVLATIVLMSYSHHGFKSLYMLPYHHGHFDWISLFRLTVQVGLIIFAATMFLWKNPGSNDVLKFMLGFLVIVIFALIRAIDNLTSENSVVNTSTNNNDDNVEDDDAVDLSSENNNVCATSSSLPSNETIDAHDLMVEASKRLIRTTLLSSSISIPSFSLQLHNGIHTNIANGNTNENELNKQQQQQQQQQQEEEQQRSRAVNDLHRIFGNLFDQDTVRTMIEKEASAINNIKEI